MSGLVDFLLNITAQVVTLHIVLGAIGATINILKEPV